MLTYDRATGGLLMTYQPNGTPGTLRCFATSGASGAIFDTGRIDLDSHADCIEGVVWEGRKVTVLCDAFYHGGADGVNQIVEYQVLPPFANILSVHFRAQVVSIPSGADTFVESGTGSDGPLNSSGFGVYDPTTTTLTAAVGEGTHQVTIAGVTVPDWTTQFRTVSLIADKTTNLLTAYVGGASVGSASLASFVGGVPTAGAFKLGAGINAARLLNGTIKDTIIVTGPSNRLGWEAYLNALP